MRKPFKHERQTITPALAKKYLEKRHLMRNPHPKFVKHLAEDIRRGNWMDSGASIVLGPEGELVDGLHRLLAVVEADAPIESLVVWLDTLDDAKIVLDQLSDTTLKEPNE